LENYDATPFGEFHISNRRGIIEESIEQIVGGDELKSFQVQLLKVKNKDGKGGTRIKGRTNRTGPRGTKATSKSMGDKEAIQGTNKTAGRKQKASGDDKQALTWFNKFKTPPPEGSDDYDNYVFWRKRLQDVGLIK